MMTHHKIIPFLALCLAATASFVTSDADAQGRKKGGGGDANGGGEAKGACEADRAFLTGPGADRCPNKSSVASRLACDDGPSRKKMGDLAAACRGAAEEKAKKDEPKPAPEAKKEAPKAPPPPATAPKDDKKDDDKVVCRGALRSVSVDINRSNCRSCGSGGLISMTHCKLELTGRLREQMCTVAFSGNKNPEKFVVPIRYNQTDATVDIQCPGKT
jgi:hypothetical protein